MNNWELSFYIAAIGWDGCQMTFDKKNIENTLKSLLHSGISWIGLDGAGNNKPSSFNLEKAVAWLADTLKHEEIKVSSFHFANPTISEPDRSQDFIKEIMKRDIETFAPLHPKSFVVHSWWPESKDEGDCLGIKTYMRMERKYGRLAIIKTIASNLKSMARVAARYNIKIAIETMGKFQPPHDKELPLLLEMIGEHNVGYCLDSGHIHACGGNVTEMIYMLGDRIYETHLHDNRASGAKSRRRFLNTAGCDEHLSPGFGTIAWIDVINALHDVGFSGPVTFETAGWRYIDDVVTSYKHAVSWWRTCESLATEKRRKSKHI